MSTQLYDEPEYIYSYALHNNGHPCHMPGFEISFCTSQIAK